MTCRAYTGFPSGPGQYFIDLDMNVLNVLSDSANLAKLMQFPDLSQQNIVSDLMGHPVDLFTTVSILQKMH